LVSGKLEERRGLELAEQGKVLSKPENQRFFVWTMNGLKLTGNPPREVVEAWVALANIPHRKPRLGFTRRVLSF
jgi:hypothetical protein